ncbi:MAG: hypothetical protein RMM17_12300 [Acidobacteriota bacterium]|nr:hypothetical protein [Blastocatellia bacterium]MDW8413451.1 hypothetical protein [Acidobacteriota bacterium]
MKNLVITLSMLSLVSSVAIAETMRKRYTFSYDRATRRASEKKAEAFAKKKFLSDFLAEKFSREIVDNLAEEIDVALEPAEDYLTDFKIVGTPRLNDDETQITVTVEGDVALPKMVAALVINKVLSFGEKPIRVMLLPSSRFHSPRATKSVRALIFEELTQAGLQSVAFEGTTETYYSSLKGKIMPGSAEFTAIQKIVKQYNTDYLIYIDAEIDNRPASIGGYICDASFIYTIMRPNDNLILGEGQLPLTRGSGNTELIAFDKVVEQVSPELVKQAVGQLYRAIFSDSQVIYNTPQLRSTITVTVYDKRSEHIAKLIEALKGTGAEVRLGSGTPVASNIEVDTTMDTLAMYEYLNGLTLQVGAQKFKVPVVGYAENTVEVEFTDINAQPKRPRPAQPPPVSPRPRQPGQQPRPPQPPDPFGRNPAPVERASPLTQAQLRSRTTPLIVLKPIQHNR